MSHPTRPNRAVGVPKVIVCCKRAADRIEACHATGAFDFDGPTLPGLRQFVAASRSKNGC